MIYRRDASAHARGRFSLRASDGSVTGALLVLDESEGRAESGVSP